MQIQYCFYHLTQSSWRQIQSLGLTNMYKEDNEFRLFCGQLDALAFLPLWEVHEGIQYIKQTISEAAEPLVDYFDRTYDSGHHNSNMKITKMYRQSESAAHYLHFHPKNGICTK